MKFLTAGESHGRSLNSIITGYPSGVKIDTDFIDNELKRRQSGYGRGARMHIEKDKVIILSGVSKNRSTGSPVSFLIENEDFKNWKNRSQEEADLLDPRPGHADLPGYIKYRLSSIRDVIERSSARETAARVCVGAFAKLMLKELGIYIISYVEQIGEESIDYNSFDPPADRSFNPEKNKKDKDLINIIEKSLLRCPDSSATDRMIGLIARTEAEGDTLGGSFRVLVTGLPPGIGSFIQWDDRIDSLLAASIMSIPSVKAISFGRGILAPVFKGSEFHDEILFNKSKGYYRRSNNAGGIEGGMTNGEIIDIRIMVKPIPTTRKGLNTVNIKNKKVTTSLKERSDVCAVPSAAVVGEAMAAITIAEEIQKKFGQDNIEEIITNFNNYLKYIKTV